MGDPLARSSAMKKESHSQKSAETIFSPRDLMPMSEDREHWRGEAGPP
jgi:hypothetical protein